MLQDDSPLASKVANSIDVIMSYWNRDLRCQFASAAHEKWFGRSPREMLGVTLAEFLGPQYELTLPFILEVLTGKTQVFEREITLHDGSVRRGIVRYYPDVAHGILHGFSVHVAIDDARSRDLELQLEQCKARVGLLATHDYLTGLPNRFLLTDRIHGLLSEAEKSRVLLGLVVINIDGLKKTNEAYGHDSGDSVIKEVARRMKSAIDATQILLRTSGDEFLLLVTGIRHTSEVNLAIDRIVRIVRQPLQYEQAALLPSVSFGIAVFPINGKTVSELLAFAYKALDQSSRPDARRPLIK
jgi:diguanylate cyclase (GGDEF)-like protein